MIDRIMFILACVGVVSYAVSGTIVAIKRRLDVFGALILATVTTFGGGLIRDITIGRTPPP